MNRVKMQGREKPRGHVKPHEQHGKWEKRHHNDKVVAQPVKTAKHVRKQQVRHAVKAAKNLVDLKAAMLDLLKLVG